MFEMSLPFTVMTVTKTKRTRTGCLCCRRRHKKCDEQRPSCKFCVTKGLVCEWPLKGSVFVTYKNSTDSVIQFEQPRSTVSSTTSEPPSINQPVSPRSEPNYTTTCYQNLKFQFTKDISPPIDMCPLQPHYNTDQKTEREPLPSLTQYHFVIPRDHAISSSNSRLRSPSLSIHGGMRLPQSTAKRLSVDSLLN